MIGPVVASSSEVTLSYVSGFTASVRQFNPVPLTNNLRIPIEVREIRVMTDTRLAAINAAAGIDGAALVFLDGKFGKDSITDGPVPISVLAPHRLHENQDSLYSDVNGEANTQTRRIILPKPLVLLPGKGFSFVASMPTSVFFTAAGAGGNYATPFSVVVRISLVGRYMRPSEKIPAMNDVPLISAVQLTQTNRVSLEDQLRNPLAKPLKVEHLVGSCIIRSGADVIGITDTSRETTVELRYPNGDRVCEEPIDFMRGLFGGQMRVWPAKFDLPSNTRIRAEISLNAGEATNPVVGYQIGLFGTRPEVNP